MCSYFKVDGEGNNNVDSNEKTDEISSVDNMVNEPSDISTSYSSLSNKEQSAVNDGEITEEIENSSEPIVTEIEPIDTSSESRLVN